MLKNAIVIVIVCLGLAACVTSSPDALLRVEQAPAGGQGAKTGQYPNLNELPQGQTNQLTEDQAEAAKRKLESDVQSANAQADRNNEAEYRREVEALRRLAEDQRKKRLSEIESRKF